jgi:hypothetical protein
MNADPENFDALLKLIALKRHEQPPPGYFDRLPGKILARLEANEEKTGFWSRVISNIVLKPAFAYSLGLAFCGTFAAGIFYTLQMQMPAQTASEPMPTQAWELATPSTDLASQQTLSGAPHVFGYSGFDNTNASYESLPSLFSNSELRSIPVSYSY